MMLYKQAWKELKYWVKIQTMFPGQRMCQSAQEEAKDIQTKMNELEKRWRIIPKKGANDEPGKNR